MHQDISTASPADRTLVDRYLTIRPGSGVATRLIEVAGELDLASSNTLQEELRRAEESGATTIVVDLSGLRFIDSSGIMILLRAAERSRDNGDRLRFLRGRGAVAHALELSGLDKELSFLD